MSSLWNVLSLFPGVSFRVCVCVWGGVVNSILSASNKQLVTLKFHTSAICFLLAGETIFSLKFKAISNTPSFLSIFFGSRGGQLTAKGALTDWSLKQKVSYNEKSPINTLAIFW